MREQQGEFDFESAAGEGYARWLAGRQLAARELALRLHLPLGHEVEVWLLDGVRLRGKLRLADEVLLIDEEGARHLELRVGRTTFAQREIESCVSLD